MNAQEARERLAAINAGRDAEDTCPLVDDAGSIWVAHECGVDREFVAGLA